MNELIYLEPDAEITSVIDRIKNAESSAVALVIPRGGTLAQSIVNLKLLKKQAEELGKEISLVSSDRISRNLASQLGLTVFSKLSEAGRAKKEAKVEKADEGDEDFKVNNYYRNKDEDGEAVEAEAETESVPEEEEADEEIGDEEKRNEQSEIEEILAKENNEEDDMDEDNESEDSEEEVISKEEPKENNNSDHFQAKKGPKPGLFSRKPIMIVVGVCIVILLALSYLFLPYATLAVQLKTEDYDTELDVVADKAIESVDAGKLKMPSQMIDLEKEISKDFDSSGKLDVGEKAKGTVTIYNSVSFQSSLLVSAGTKITSNGKVFLTQKDITVPKGTYDAVLQNGVPVLKTTPGSAEVAVVADNSGETYNLQPTKFSVGSYSQDKAYAESKEAFSGGTTKVLKVVTSNDISKASDSVSLELAKAGKDELIEKAKGEQLSISEGDIKSEVISEATSKNPNDEAEKFNYKIKMKFYVLGFSNKDLESLMLASVQEKIGNSKMILNPDQSEITYKITDSSVDDGVIKLSSKYKGKIGNRLDSEQIKAIAKNKSISGVSEALKKNENVTSVDVKIWPSFFKRTPLLKNRIKINFDYAK